MSKQKRVLMKTRKMIQICMAMMAMLAWVGFANAALVTESEVDGEAVNNSSATAQVIAAGSFTIDPNSNIFTAAEDGLPVHGVRLN